jgi:methionine-S-sulfoxide reductase
LKEIYLAGGCFWGTQLYLDYIPGVTSTEVGYANGNGKPVTYAEVCTGIPGYAECVHVVYDDSVLPLEMLLALYYQSIDPLSYGRQGMDYGIQYRTGIYYVDSSDRSVIDNSLQKLANTLQVSRTEIEVMPLKNFYPAELYHQKYLEKNPDGYCHISPRKLAKVKALKNEL